MFIRFLPPGCQMLSLAGSAFILQRLTPGHPGPKLIITEPWKSRLMKTLLALVFCFALLSAKAQATRTENLLESTGTQRGKQAAALTREAKPNEIVKGNVTYSGIAVQAVKTSNPIQLFNPAAPARYGSAEDNTLRDPMTGRSSGLKIFSIRF